MTSFKVKLAFYFVLLAVLPLAVLSWDFARAQQADERRLVDARLHVDLRSALSAYRRELDAAAAAARNAAHSRTLARALVDDDVRTLRNFARRTRVVVLDGRRRFGSRPSRAAVQTVTLAAQGHPIGAVEGFVALDQHLAQRLERRAGLNSADRLAFADTGGSFTRATVVRRSGTRFRMLAAPLPGATHTRLLAMTPERVVDAATAAAWRRLGVAVLLALLFVSIVGYLEGRRIVRSIRSLVSAARAIAAGRLDERASVRGRDELATLGYAFNDMAEQLDTRLTELAHERARLREVISGFGAALAATHDDRELLRVIVATAVEATGAHGGKFVSSDGTLVECGDVDTGERFELPVAAGPTTFGRLVLAGQELSAEAAETARSLAAQAAVALENAQLHALVARQALTDGLTGLGNRRQAEQALGREIARCERFGGTFAVVLADIDRFKQLNDEHGHAAGDAVLREFAGVLRAAVRDADVAARWGGEEFLLVLAGTDADGAANLAERIRAELEGKTVLSPDGTPLRVTASFGVASSGGDDVIAAADEALYAAKRAGRNRVVVAGAVAAS